MKAVFQNTLFGVLCLASVVWAAPTQTVVPCFRMMIAETDGFSDKPTQTRKQAEPANCPAADKPSLMEGTIRFACW